MRHVAAICFFTFLALLVLPQSLRAGVFDVDTLRAERGEIYSPWALNSLAKLAPKPFTPPGNGPATNLAALEPSSLMLDRLRGIMLRLTSQHVGVLRGMTKSGSREPIPESATQFAIIRLTAVKRQAFVEIRRDQIGNVWAREIDIQSPPKKTALGAPLGVPLDRTMFDSLVRSMWWYTGFFDSRARTTNGTSSAQPLDEIQIGTFISAPYRVSGADLDKRFTGKQYIDQTTDRDLTQERFAIYVPASINASKPASLLIWLNPIPNGSIPRELIPALEAQGIIAVSPTDAASTRTVTNRVQLCLDAAYTMMSRYHVDPARIYIGGFSAGGGFANLVWMAYPEVFQGVLLVSGASFYQEVQAGPAAYWGKQYNEPYRTNIALLAGKRVAAIAGETDPGRPYVEAVAKRMQLESIDAKSFIALAQGHHVPTPADLTKALNWLDGIATENRSTKLEESNALERDLLLPTPTTKPTDKPRTDKEIRKAIARITRETPWTPAAWRAAELVDGLVIK